MGYFKQAANATWKSHGDNYRSFAGMNIKKVCQNTDTEVMIKYHVIVDKAKWWPAHIAETIFIVFNRKYKYRS